MKVYAGIDLHSSNNYIGIIDQQDQKRFGKRLSNDLDSILMALNPFKKEMEGVVVESTYNWYWLVDGLQANGYDVRLANPSAVKQYEGLKHTDDKSDAYWLAQMLRLNILPEGYIYPREERDVRDLLRRRLLFVRQRTALILSFQSMVARNLGGKISTQAIKQLAQESATDLFTAPSLGFAAEKTIAGIRFLGATVKEIEKHILSRVKLRKEFELLQTIPGIGKILALTIMLEVGDIARFPAVGNYSSYCRCVNSKRISNGKKKGENNRKNGNKYLAWAYVEAANFATRYCPEAQRFYQRKKAAKNGVVAIKALSNKLARASYFMLRDQTAFDKERLFRS
jgi:transposase